MSTLRLFATAPAAVSALLAAEVQNLGARRPRPVGAGVEFSADLETAYRVCLWSRLASRVLLPLARVAAVDGDALYDGARGVAWESHLPADATFAVDCSVRRARIAHSHFAALRVKDAIADRFRKRTGKRPSVDPREPDLRVHLHLRGGEGRLSLDLSGASLHRRGYRAATGLAPLRETLAAAVLVFAGWPDRDRLPALLDPLCGSGTLLIEAALMAGDVAPGLLRRRFAFESWLGHDAARWARLLDEARARRERGLVEMPPIAGGDRDPAVLAAARDNVARAGLAPHVHLEACELSAWLQRPAPAARGLLVSNPPFGERLDNGAAATCREQLRALAEGPMRAWTLALLLPADAEWPPRPAGRTLAVPNGPLACRIHVLEPRRDDTRPRVAAPVPVNADAFANRLRKNERHLARWRRREGVDCYRVYDADLPEFALAIDVYACREARWAHVQEYAPPATIDPASAAARRAAALARLPECLQVSPEHVVVKTRRRQRGSAQYQRRDTAGRLLEVREGAARLLVNLTDFLDTGLFLDHRPLRRWLHDHARGKRVANLFAYTGAASVHAALGGARETLSVDLSAGYLDWCRRNLSLNGFHAPAHRTLRADCLAWLRDPPPEHRARFDLVLVDPPTFSNSKRMRATFDVQRDHVPLVRTALELLAPGGTLIFSCNRRGFRLDADALRDIEVTDWTRPSIPPDFARRVAPHQCYFLRRTAAGG